MKTARVGAGGCYAGAGYVYVFGGRGGFGSGRSEEYYDSIERYSIELNVWSEISVKMP